MKTRLAIAALVAWSSAFAANTAAAASETYEIDPLHTYPSFEFSHMGLSTWRGKFDKTSGTVVFDRQAKTGTVDVVVETASIDFGLDEMDAKAKSDDFFDVAKFPTMTYSGTLQFVGDEPKYVDGKVTIHGVTKPLKLTINSWKCMVHPFYKKDVCGADAQGELNWGDYGMKLSQYAEGEMGRLVMHIQVEGLKKEDAPKKAP
jgi:polyisoprenoid-binding protein YceI